ncbi:endonuclease/exonuclease/phosphatase family protein [Aliifodinibius salicampi]|uniref:Endonuclease/exonuclease/phosphatase family protein n=1 Tax=Fodinibius salicampi TaxID=1920655 RepID=A0ABT3PWJ0_9BACT|nr:endonuclease/exonuclease/phosphatase family protein [Fodinibius salicampi]MCW9712220.1 endonuclease/exonuclease/phosphatase family protein [Fodinibius salicampi]
MSYNIRYDNPDDAPNHWDNRKGRVANVIKFYDPAFVGTQEGLIHQLTYLDQELSNYEWIGQGRKDGKHGGEFSAIFYDTRKVKLVKESDSTVWLSETPQKPSKSWDAALPRILTWGLFEVKSTGEQVYVFNTHFDHVGEVARLESSKLILKVIREVAGKKPAVLTGDFNVMPDSEPYATLTSGTPELNDAYEISVLSHVGPSFTFEGFKVNGGSDGRRIDYIFANNEIRVNKHAILTSFQEGFYPSDHLPVYAEIEIK